jgi:hypothetical protein
MQMALSKQINTLEQLKLLTTQIEYFSVNPEVGPYKIFSQNKFSK